MDARHVKTAKGVASPFVEVELTGMSGEAEHKRRTARADSNSFCPRWDKEVFVFDVCGRVRYPSWGAIERMSFFLAPTHGDDL